MAHHKAKQISTFVIRCLAAGFCCAQICGATDADKDFLPVPGEVTAPPPLHAVPAPPLPAKTNSVPVPTAPAPDAHSRSTATAATSPSGNDWGAYNHDRATKVLLDGKLVEKSSLTALVGFLASEHAKLGDGHKIFTGAAFDLAERKPVTGKVASAMELRPSFWRNTNERVFLMGYKAVTSMPGALLRVYVVETDPLEGWRTFKTGNEPTFEEWKRLGGR